MLNFPFGYEKDYSHPAVQGVLYCNKLFEYERIYKEKGLSYKQIQKRRLKDHKPVIEGFLAWLNQVNPGSNSKLKKAITYVQNRRDFLMTYLEDGRCSLSNNLSENAIRPVTVGRKNWLFSDTPDGATANSLYLTMVEMAKAYNLNLYEYLKFLLSIVQARKCQMRNYQNLHLGMQRSRIFARIKWSKTLAFRNPSNRARISVSGTPRN